MEGLLFDFTYGVNFNLNSSKPCSSCEDMADSAPFLYVSQSSDLPDPSTFEYLRPHGNCKCVISVDRVDITPDDEIRHIVKNKREVLIGEEEHREHVQDMNNPTNETLGINITSTQKNLESEAASSKTSYGGSLGVSGSASHEGVTGSAEAHGSHEESSTSSDDNTVYSHQNLDIPPNQSGAIVNVTITKTWHIFGDLFRQKLKNGQVVEEYFAGVITIGTRQTQSTTQVYQVTNTGTVLER